MGSLKIQQESKSAIVVFHFGIQIYADKRIKREKQVEARHTISLCHYAINLNKSRLFEVRKRKKITSRQNNGICVSVLFEFIQLKKKRKMKLNFFLHASKWIMSILLRIDSFFFCAS